MSSATTSSALEAIELLKSCVNFAAEIPDRVFAPEFGQIHVVDFEFLLTGNLVELVQLLMHYEQSSVAAIIQISDLYGSVADWRDHAFFVEYSTVNQEYNLFVNRNIAAFAEGSSSVSKMEQPWKITAKTIAVSSNFGSWVVYGDKHAEIALLGFKHKLTRHLEKKLLTFQIERLGDALKRDTFFGSPGNEIAIQQRANLRDSYLR